MIKNIGGKKSAFSLIEMSIVLVIAAIVISSMLTISSVNINNEKTRLTKERIDEIYKALGIFMLKNYRLPCPASLTLSKTVVGSYGVEVGPAGSCNGASGVYSTSSGVLSNLPVYGAVPVNTIGLPDEFAEDGFGSKFAYIVFKNYTKAEYPASTNLSGFSYSSGAGNALPAVISMPSASINASNAFVIISFGSNKYGAFNAAATTQNSKTGASTYELQNMLINIAGSTAEFGNNASNNSSITFTASDSSSNVFDDIVFSKRRDEMITDFDAMFLMPCLSPGAGYSDAYYGKIQYRTSACPSPNGAIFPSIECSAFGISITKQSCP